MTNKQRLHCKIYGQVQGVCFRWSTVEEATRLGVVGWVRNRADGSVELEAEGTKAALDALLAWAHHGPAGARVDRLVPEWSESTETGEALPALGAGGQTGTGTASATAGAAGTTAGRKEATTPAMGTGFVILR